jgi:D-threonate/D-erythronate kinase
VRLGDKAVWAGAAGLAKYLPLAAGWEKAASGAGLAAPVEGPVLFVVGSMSRVSHEQVEKLAAETDIQHLVVPPDVLRHGEHHAQWQEIAARLDLALSNGEDVVIMLGAEEKPVIGEGLELCRSLSQLVAPHATRIGALVSTGGETARAVLVAFGAAGLRLVGEVEPGVPLSVTEGGLRGSKPLPVITKAGAFGHPDTFLKCLSTLRLHGATQRIKTFSRHV